MLVLNNVNFAFAKAEILKNISLTLPQGTHMGIMGESGCGKSTLLNYIYGLLPYQKGKVIWRGEELAGAQDHLVPGHPMMKYIPQEFDLMPFTTVAENVGEHLSIQLDDRKDRIAELLEVVDLKDLSARKVKTLSGGQKQRVAIAKALAQEPELLLLDEPFSHIDHFRRSDLRRRLYNFLNQKEISSIIATHDREDVLAFTNELLVMRKGKAIDRRLTKEVYNNPQTIYTAALFDEVNEVDGKDFGKSGRLLLYPHQLHVVKKGYRVEVVKSYFHGTHFLIHVADSKGKSLFFIHHEGIEPDNVVELAINQTTRS